MSAGVEEATARRLRRGLERRVHRADQGRGPARSEGLVVLRGRAEGVVRGGPADGVMKSSGYSACRNWIIRQFLPACPRRPARRRSDWRREKEWNHASGSGGG